MENSTQQPIFDGPPCEAAYANDPSINPTQIKEETMRLCASKDTQIPVLQHFENYRITEKTDIAQPDTILELNGQIVATVEEITTISGPPKSGKSAFISMCIAGAITENERIQDGIEGMVVKQNRDHKAVIHLDTEQARHKHQKNLMNNLKRAGLSRCPEFYLSYNIRKLDLDEYENVTQGICNAAYEQFGGIHSIWIDGGADYIADVNNQDTSNAIIKFFVNLAIEYHTAVFIIVHTNPGGDKERGHFGSQSQRKGAAIITVKSDGDTSFIELKFLRYGGAYSTGKLMFKYDNEKGYHVGCGVKNQKETQEEQVRRKVKLIREICEKVFTGHSFKYPDAINQIMIKRACSERTAKAEFTQMKIHGMIEQGFDSNWKLNEQYINEL